jgi:hypothetical protein
MWVSVIRVLPCGAAGDAILCVACYAIVNYDAGSTGVRGEIDYAAR